MKKNKIFLFSAAALLALGLVGCATAPTETGTASTDTATQNETGTATQTSTATPAPVLTVTTAEQTVKVGAEVKVTTTLTNSTAPVTITVDNDELATVVKKDDGTYVKGVAVGNVTVTATAGTITATTKVSVYEEGKAATDLAKGLVKATAEHELAKLSSGTRDYKIKNSQDAVIEDTKTTYTIYNDHTTINTVTDNKTAKDSYVRTTAMGKDVDGTDVLYVHDLTGTKTTNFDTYKIADSGLETVTKAEAEAYTSSADFDGNTDKYGVNGELNTEVFVQIAKFNYTEGATSKLGVDADGNYVFTAEGTSLKYVKINFTFDIHENGMLENAAFTRTEYFKGTAEKPQGNLYRTVTGSYALTAGTRTASPAGKITPDGLTYKTYTPILVNSSGRQLTEVRVGDTGLSVSSLAFKPEYACNDNLTITGVTPADAATIDEDTNTLTITKKYEEITIAVESVKGIKKTLAIPVVDPVVTNITANLADTCDTNKQIFITMEVEGEGSMDIIKTGYTYELDPSSTAGCELTYDADGPILNSTTEGEATLIIKNAYAKNEDGTLKEFRFTTTFKTPAPDAGGETAKTPIETAIETLTDVNAEWTSTEPTASVSFSPVDGETNKIQIITSIGEDSGIGYLLFIDESTEESPWLSLEYIHSMGAITIEVAEFGFDMTGQKYNKVHITGTLLGDPDLQTEDKPFDITFTKGGAEGTPTPEQKIAEAVTNLASYGEASDQSGTAFMQFFATEEPNVVKLSMTHGDNVAIGNVTISYVDGWYEMEYASAPYGNITINIIEFGAKDGVQDLDQVIITGTEPGAAENDPEVTINLVFNKAAQ